MVHVSLETISHWVDLLDTVMPSRGEGRGHLAEFGIYYGPTERTGSLCLA